MSAECASYLTDFTRACGSPLAVRLTHCSIFAAYVLAVTGCAALRPDPWSAAQILALRLPQASRVLQHLQRDALSTATALHGHADSSQTSLSTKTSPSSASQRRTIHAAHVGGEGDVQPGQGVLPDSSFFFFWSEAGFSTALRR